MMLDHLLKKLGVKSVAELNAEERSTYRDWEAALAGRRITDEDVSKFFETELEDVLKKLPSQRLGSSDDTFLKMKLEFLRSVRSFLDLPAVEKAAAEAALARQLDALP